MSVYFSMIDGPTETETFECQCNGTRPDCLDCHGTGKVVFTRPVGEFNLANGNARGFLPLLGLDGDNLYGSIPADQIWPMMLRVAELIATAEERQPAIREGYDTRGFGGCRIIDPGCPDSQVMRYLVAFGSLLNLAVKHQSGIHWS